MKILIAVLVLVITGCQNNSNLSPYEELERNQTKRRHQAEMMAKRGFSVRCYNGKRMIYPNGTTEIRIKKDCLKRGRIGIGI